MDKTTKRIVIVLAIVFLSLGTTLVWVISPIVSGCFADKTERENEEPAYEITASVFELNEESAIEEAVGFVLEGPSEEEAAKPEPKTAEEFFLELEGIVGRKAQFALGFDRDKAVEFLIDRKSAIEVSDSIRSQDPTELNWIFAEVISEPLEENDGQHYEMMVRPLNTSLSIYDFHEFSPEVLVHGYTEYYPGEKEIRVGDMVLFPMLDSSPRNDEGLIDRVYSYTLISDRAPYPTPNPTTLRPGEPPVSPHIDDNGTEELRTSEAPALVQPYLGESRDHAADSPEDRHR